MLNNKFIPYEQSIAHNIEETCKKYPKRPALVVDNRSYSYSEIYELAIRIASTIMDLPETQCVILSSRSYIAYISILASLLAGKAYVVLNNKDPISRLETSFSQIKSSLLIVDNSQLSKSILLTQRANRQITIVLPEGRLGSQSRNVSNVRIISSDEFKTTWVSPKKSYKYAYMMQTSGSTGMPKCVVISHANLKAYVNNITFRVRPTPEDRFSQITELSFDFSIHDIFTAWCVGACLCVLPHNYMLGIPKYICDNQITFWASVPSTITMLQQLKRLHFNCFPSVRYSIFCGEALMNKTAELWHRSAPSSVIDNLYGPTEATVAITGYIWTPDNHYDITPIGHPFNNQCVYLLDYNNRLINQKGKVGEICLAGSQVSDGYWQQEKLTSECFINIDTNISCYKTGDLAYFNQKYGLIYKGRLDDQIKIRGYRVEKIEIESAIRKITKAGIIAIVPRDKDSDGNVSSLTCFMSDSSISLNKIAGLCREQLPDYMVPHDFVKIDDFPYSNNGKIDYRRLEKLIKKPK